MVYKYRERWGWDPHRSDSPTQQPKQQLSHKKPLLAMSHLTTVQSTPDHARTSKVHPPTKKSKSRTSSFSLKDQLKSLHRKSAPSSSTTRNVTLNGLKSDRQAKGARFSLFLPPGSNSPELTRPPQTRRKTDHSRAGIAYTQQRSETFVPGGYSSRRVPAFAIADLAPSCFGYFFDHLAITSDGVLQLCPSHR